MFIHIDLDAFFISAASTTDKNLIGKKAAVASESKFDIFGDYQDIGIILSASYEARSVGIRCAMHANLAKNLPRADNSPYRFQSISQLIQSTLQATFKLH